MCSRCSCSSVRSRLRPSSTQSGCESRRRSAHRGRSGGRRAVPAVCRCSELLVHQYFGVDVDVVRDVVDNYLPPLAEALRSHVPDD
ncbi:HepT-like ribonuclease domain-containing protein [Gordonia asplenii]|uniref:HepT-like ribonuclease domain-containing protein n=1 Tax=Gordonia asplenii TaxID=2725283 RepID=UPI001FECD0FE|nr:HepT-like ribonuclease domain-containing protein [Gordonia asplenii]